ncbi:MAG: arginase family protein [Bacteroidales bacterium]|jgi:arginase family enzyme|nr:arginase family protein [Bacteroidales bacterium]
MEENSEKAGLFHIDLSDIEGARCYCSPEAREIAVSLVADMPVAAVHKIGSGNYHYVTELFMERIGEPFMLVLLDHHTDMLPPRFGGDIMSCGGWVREALDNNDMLKKVAIIGFSDDSEEEIGPGYRSDVIAVTESEVALRGCRDIDIKKIVDAFPDLPVYLSIDTDVLGIDYAVTDWGNGTMTLPVLLDYLKAVCAQKRVLGADICGKNTHSVKEVCDCNASIINERTEREIVSVLKNNINV